jgi:hypothetical protein
MKWNWKLDQFLEEGGALQMKIWTSIPVYFKNGRDCPGCHNGPVGSEVDHTVHMVADMTTAVSAGVAELLVTCDNLVLPYSS